MDPRKVLIVLDRDGVLNATIPNPAEPRPDSPLRASEVVVFPWVPGVLRALCDAGHGLVIASNQPAAAKGKTTMDDLRAVHQRVIEGAESEGARILSSHICFHRSEDRCACRKPGTALLEEAFARHAAFDVAASWMVGDRATDVLAGAALGMKTALVAGPDGDSADELAALAARAVRPSFCGDDLRDFGRFLLA